MLIYLYEDMINEDGTRIEGRLVGEVRCAGDGTPGEFTYFDACNEIWEIKDVNDHNYGKKRIILDDFKKHMLECIFKRNLNIMTGGGIDKNGVHHVEGRFIKPWEKEAIEYIIKYEFENSKFGTVRARIIEP